MSPAPRFNPAKEDKLPADILHLAQMISALPEEHRGELEAAVSRVIEHTKRRRRILQLVQEALSQLRLDMKYLVFDLEATRRERDAYRESQEGGNS